MVFCFGSPSNGDEDSKKVGRKSSQGRSAVGRKSSSSTSSKSKRTSSMPRTNSTPAPISIPPRSASKSSLATPPTPQTGGSAASNNSISPGVVPRGSLGDTNTSPSLSSSSSSLGRVPAMGGRRVQSLKKQQQQQQVVASPKQNQQPQSPVPLPPLPGVKVNAASAPNTPAAPPLALPPTPKTPLGLGPSASKKKLFDSPKGAGTGENSEDGKSKKTREGTVATGVPTALAATPAPAVSPGASSSSFSSPSTPEEANSQEMGLPGDTPLKGPSSILPWARSSSAKVTQNQHPKARSGGDVAAAGKGAESTPPGCQRSRSCNRPEAASPGKGENSGAGARALAFLSQVRKSKSREEEEGEAADVVPALQVKSSTGDITQPPAVRAAKPKPKLVEFTEREMAEATEEFSEECVIGEGGFGPVYQGWIHSKRLQGLEFEPSPSVCDKGFVAVAIKILKEGSHQGDREWLAEVSYLGHMRHPHLVRLLGFCIQGSQRTLVYEYLPQGSLEQLLFAPGEEGLGGGGLGDEGQASDGGSGGSQGSDGLHVLTWHERINIALGTAKGLSFLHEGAGNTVIYRDLKTSNILLDHNYNAKLSDFGLARDGPMGEQSHVSTRIVGTVGYAAPEYIMTGHLTTKSDVWAFGIVLLELLTGRLALDKRRPKDEQSLVEWSEPFLEQPAKLYRIMDPSLRGKYSVKGAQAAAAVARGCLHKRAKQRPKMSAVVKALEPLLELHDMAGFVLEPPLLMCPSADQRHAKTRQNGMTSPTGRAVISPRGPAAPVPAALRA